MVKGTVKYPLVGGVLFLAASIRIGYETLAYNSNSAITIRYLGIEKLLDTSILHTGGKEQDDEPFDSNQPLQDDHDNQNSDGCGLYRNSSSVDTVRASWGDCTMDELSYLERVHQCGKRFEMADHKLIRPFNEDNHIQLLQCDVPITPEDIEKTILTYETVWFIGDSILAQQFYLFICMVNPELRRSDMTQYTSNMFGTANQTINADYKYTHGDNSSTTFKYSRFGRKWDPTEYNLYENALPVAVQEFAARPDTKNAIVLDAGAHYDSETAPLMERALQQIKSQSEAAATMFYYVESAPEEWPTSNGIFADGCTKKCKCQVLSEAQIAGTFRQLPGSIDRRKQKNTSVDFVERYDIEVVHNNSTEGCYPDCWPATWRRDVAMAVFRDSSVETVPVWWQMVDKGTPNYMRHGDCLHKSFEALVMMNQQLVRTMITQPSNRKKKRKL